MNSEIENRLWRVAEEEGGIVLLRSPMIVWRENYPELPMAFRVAIYTGHVVERKRFFSFSHMSEALALGVRGFADATWMGAFEAFRDGAKEVELRPLHELETEHAR